MRAIQLTGENLEAGYHPAMAEMSSHAVTIDVTGVGRVSVPPTMAGLRAAVRGRGKKATTAVKASATAARKVLKALDDHPAVAGDQGIGHASVHERTRWDGEQEIVEGWEAHHQIDVTITDVRKAFAVLADVAAVDGVSVVGPEWIVETTHPAYDEARQRAVDDARMKAASYASAAGLLLGRLVTISDAAGSTPVAMLERASASGGLPPADLDVAASVRLVFEATSGAS